MPFLLVILILFIYILHCRYSKQPTQTTMSNLVFQIIQNKRRVASIRYRGIHDSCICNKIANKLINICNLVGQATDIRLYLIKHLESSGGGIDNTDNLEIQRISQMFPNMTFDNTGDVNDGLIALSQNGMDVHIAKADILININLDDNKIYTV